ncbi:MAG TPA: hypothetical protein VIO33_05520 [Burkholderiaceae bacterium]
MSTAIVAIAMLSGCATQVTKGTTSDSAAASATAAPAQPVTVPAASAKKVVLSMTGPKNVTDSKDWASFKEEWRATFAEHAKDAGIAFSVQEGSVAAGVDGTLLNVYVNDYRQVGIGSRIFFGVMTGNAFIDAKVQFASLSNGQTFGTQTYNTTSSAWHGVFGKMTPQQVDAIAAEIFAEIKNH